MFAASPSPRQRGHAVALAARRGMLAGGVLGAALVAHAVGVGGLSIVPIAPAMWMMFVAGAMLAGVLRGRVFRPRSAVGTLALLVVGQAVLHAGITVAPWAFGLEIHHAGDLLPGAGPLVTHAAAAIVLALLIARAEQVLSAALRVARSLVAPVRVRARRRGAAPLCALPVLTVRIPVHGLRRALPRRGPPVPA